MPVSVLLDRFLTDSGGNNISDIDLTILYPSKANCHPDSFSEKLISHFKERTNQEWKVQTSRRLYLLNSKIEDKLEVEISFNNITGLANSEYIRTLAEFDLRFHKLGYFIKHFVSELKIFTKQKKLNSFSLMGMLIVYLQDIVKPPVLPRIIKDSSYNESRGLNAYSYTQDRDGKNRGCIGTPIFPNFETELYCMIEDINTQNGAELFRGFIHYYFGGGFDPLHDVVDTRAGKILKIKQILAHNDDGVKGISLKIQEILNDSGIAVLDPFDRSYVPSKNFNLKNYKEDHLPKMGKFVISN